MTTDELDALLAVELGVGDRLADTRFAHRVERAIVEKQRYGRQLRRTVIDGTIDLVGVTALICGLFLLSRTAALAPLASEGVLQLSSPLALVLLLWLGVQRWKLA